MARELTTYQGFLRRLSPAYDDCPEPCALTERDRRGMCDQCDVAKQWEFFEQSFAEQINLRFEGRRIEWTFDTLYADCLRLMNFDAKLNGKGYPKDCTVTTARALDIWRREQFRPTRIARWELEQKLKGKADD